jgi:5'-nucleotidase
MHLRRGRMSLLLLLGLLVGGWAPGAALADQTGACGSCQDNDSPALRKAAACRLTWRKPKWCRCREDVDVEILGINDFHGQISKGRAVAGRPVGGAEVLASWLRAAMKDGDEDRTFLVHAGDQVGASPAASALLQDEPSITFLNLLAKDACRGGRRNPWGNVVGTLGNHEFDEGKAELLRLIYGGNYPTGPFLEAHWHGADFPYICSNVVDKATGQTLLPPCLTKNLGRGLKIGFIGAVLRSTPTIVTPTGVAGLDFLDEADCINACVKKLQKQGVHAIVVQIHQGGFQTSYSGPTSPVAGAVSGEILDIVSRLDDDVDVVISGHTHAFTNALLNNAHGTPILVTQAFSYSTAYADVQLVVDGCSGDVVEKSAAIQTTWGDEGPGLTPQPDVAALVAAAEAKVAPLVSQVIGTAATALTRTENAAGESDLGKLIADAQRAQMGTDFAFMNPGGIRNDLAAGQVTWGDLFSVQPFGNSLVKMNMTGAQVKALLEQQWGPPQPAAGRILKISGLTYQWSASAPFGSRVSDIRKGGVPIDMGTSYSVTCNSFLAAGGDNFTEFTLGTGNVGGPVDLDALIAYIQTLPQPFSAPADVRITVVPSTLFPRGGPPACRPPRLRPVARRAGVFGLGPMRRPRGSAR